MHTDPFPWLGCNGNKVRWYLVLSKFISYSPEDGNFVDSLYQKLLIITNICWSYLKTLQVFLSHSVGPQSCTEFYPDFSFTDKQTSQQTEENIISLEKVKKRGSGN